MTKSIIYILLGLMCFTACTKDRDIEREPIVTVGERVIIYYWDFNNDNIPEDIIAPTIQETDGKTAFSFVLNGSELPYCNDADQSCWESVNDGTFENLPDDFEPGRALRLRNPCSYLDIEVPTTGYAELNISYAVRRTGSGAQKQIIQYTADGATHSSMGLEMNEFTIMEDYNIIELDLEDVAAANDNPNFGIRIIFEDGNNNNSGNNRLDNLTITGKAI